MTTEESVAAVSSSNKDDKLKKINKIKKNIKHSVNGNKKNKKNDEDVVVAEQVDQEEEDEDEEEEDEDDDSFYIHDIPFINEYKGFTPDSADWTPDRVDLTLISSQEFFDKYVATRTPCILTKGHEHLLNPLKKWADLDYLNKITGDDVVQIETRDHEEEEEFGSGRERRHVLMKDLIASVREGDDSVYLSTQYDNDDDDEENEDDYEDDGEDINMDDDEHVHGENCNHDHHHGLDENDDDEDEDEEEDEENGDDNEMEDDDEEDADEDEEEDEDEDEEEDEAEILLQRFEDYCKPPLQRLLSDFPIRPEIVKTLVPQQVNLWMGAAPKEGVSSGLHHDFADNLYIVIKGRKTFTCFPPSDAPNLYLNGPAARVFHNGLIQYADRCIRADGAFVADVARWKANKAWWAVREAVENGELEREKEARREFDEAMREWAEVEEDGELDDDYLPDDNEDGDKEGGDGDEDDDDDDDDNDENEDVDMMDQDDDQNNHDDDEEDEEEEDEDIFDNRFENIISGEPPSFSLIDTATLRNGKNIDEFPMLKDAMRVSFNVKEGEMLYLPASWFHEVQSFPTETGNKSTPSKPNLHMAFNYWFHPPTESAYSQPYEDNYWEEAWEDIANLIEGSNDDAMGFGDLPLTLRLSRARPGVWFMRDKKSGRFLGAATRATFPRKAVLGRY